MRKTPQVLLILFALSLSLCTATTIPLYKGPKQSKFPILKGFSVDGVGVTLSQANPGFYVSVDFTGDALSDDSASSDDDGTPMMVALYTSATVLSNTCLGFLSYGCDNYPCTALTSNASSVFLPYFQAQGYSAISDILVDAEYWTLATSATIATSCPTSASSSYGSNAFGLLGMGLNGNARLNYMSCPVFSVYLEEDNSDDDSDYGQLLFDSDLSNAESPQPVAILAADLDWHVSNVTSVQVGSQSVIQVTTPTSLIFDLNADAIGLPLPLFTQVISSLNSNPSMNCSTEAYYLPSCTYSGDTDNLPNIQISVGDSIIALPSNVYLRSGVDDDDDDDDSDDEPMLIVLNLRALDPTLTGPSYVTPAYANYVILDSNVMTYYYVVFNGCSSQSITLYKADQSSHAALIIVLSCIGALLAVSLGVLVWYCYKRREKKGLLAEGLKRSEPSETTITSHSTPVITFEDFPAFEQQQVQQQNQNAQYTSYSDNFQPQPQQQHQYSNNYTSQIELMELPPQQNAYPSLPGPQEQTWGTFLNDNNGNQGREQGNMKGDEF